MTIKIRAKIRRSPIGAFWLVSAQAFDPDQARPSLAGFAATDTHAEAIQVAHRLLRDLDRELIAEVHESRSSRRAARVATLADEAAAVATWPRPPIIPLTPLAHLYTMEATA